MAKRKKKKRRDRVVIVGCGGMANAWVKVAQSIQNLEVVGLVDLNREAAEALAERHGFDGSVVYDSLEDAVEQADPNIAFDVTVPAAHFQVSGQALDLGLHVMCEKPLATNMEDARKLVKKAKKAKRVYAVMQNRRYLSSITGLRRFLESEKVGAIEEVHSDFFVGARFSGFRNTMPHPLLMDMAIHSFDEARYISGVDPVAVYCHAFNPKRSWYEGDASAVAIFEMEDGVVYTYRGSWCAEGANTHWNCDWKIHCGNGAVTWDGGEELAAQRLKDTKKAREGFMGEYDLLQVPTRKMKHTGHAGCIREFIEGVREGKTPQTHGEDNIKSLAMVRAAIESAETGKRVKIRI